MSYNILKNKTENKILPNIDQINEQINIFRNIDKQVSALEVLEAESKETQNFTIKRNNSLTEN